MLWSARVQDIWDEDRSHGENHRGGGQIRAEVAAGPTGAMRRWQNPLAKCAWWMSHGPQGRAEGVCAGTKAVCRGVGWALHE